MSTIRGLYRGCWLVFVCLLLLFVHFFASIIHPILKHYPKWNEGLFRVTMKGYIFHLLIKVTNIQIKTHIKASSPLSQSKVLFLSNHVNYLDVVALSIIHPMGFVAKEEVGEWPLIGSLVKRMNTIFVKRERIWDRVRCIRDIQDKITDMCYCIFPEGTTSKSLPDIKNWKGGHLLAVRDPGVRVMAVGIYYEDHEQLSWIDDMTFTPHLWQTLKRKRNLIHIKMEEVDISNEDLRDLRQLSYRIYESVCRLTKESAKSIENSTPQSNTVELSPSEGNLHTSQQLPNLG